MSTSVLAGEETRTGPDTLRPYLLGSLASLSVGAAAIHFAVVFEHFAEYTLYGVFFLVISWAQIIWPVILLRWPSRLWLWLGIAGNAAVIAVYAASRTAGLPFGPDLHSPESVGALDVVSCVLEFGLIAVCAALLWRPSLADRTVAPRGAFARAAAQLITKTDTSLKRYANVQAALAAGYTYVLKTNGEEHLLYDGPNPAYQGLNPRDPSSLVYAINVPGHAPILLGAMYIMGDAQAGPQIGGGLTRWHSHLVTCVNGQQIIAGFGVQLRGGCNPASWQDRYTSQMLHVWVVPYPGGVFSDDLSRTATDSAVQAVLAEHR